MAYAHLTDNDVLHLREMGLYCSPVEKALLILTATYPDMSREQLATLSIGERDARLLAVRERTFGNTLDVFTTCPNCRQALEMRLATVNLYFPQPTNAGDTGQGYTTQIDHRTVRYRLPNSTDLEAVLTCKDIGQAQQILLQRCVLAVHDSEGMPVLPTIESGKVFPADFVTTLAERMVEQDPQAEVLLNLRCVECQHEWQSLFDIAAFFWAELESHAKRLLNEVYILARTYHWREQDILALSPLRRRWYLEMATT